MASPTGTLYVGMTNNLERRAGEHKAGEVDGFTKTYECTKLVYYEETNDVLQAIVREKQLKGWRREKKEALIQTMNPGWDDLAAEIFL